MVLDVYEDAQHHQECDEWYFVQLIPEQVDDHDRYAGQCECQHIEHTKSLLNDLDRIRQDVRIGGYEECAYVFDGEGEELNLFTKLTFVRTMSAIPKTILAWIRPGRL